MSMASMAYWSLFVKELTPHIMAQALGTNIEGLIAPLIALH